MESKSQIGRLCFRHEGKNWNCYYAMQHTMEGCIFIGSIAMSFVERKERKDQFMAMMRECFSDMVEEAFGTRPTWPEPEGNPAPEHERTKE